MEIEFSHGVMRACGNWNGEGEKRREVGTDEGSEELVKGMKRSEEHVMKGPGYGRSRIEN